MLKRYFIYSILIIGILTSCSNRKVTRVDPNDQIDLTGDWNGTDSKLTANALIEQILNDKWLSNHVDEKHKKPVLIVGMVTNQSHEHIEAETFMNDLEKALIVSQKVGLVQSGKKREELRGERADMQTNASVNTIKKFGLENGADYILQGSINSIVDAYKKKKAVTYQVDLSLTNLETNEVVWIGDKKIAKYIKN